MRLLYYNTDHYDPGAYTVVYGGIRRLGRGGGVHFGSGRRRRRRRTINYYYRQHGGDGMRLLFMQIE